MPLLVPGQNTSLPAPVVMARVTGAVDLTALVVSPDGKVAGDADMVFFNQPRGPGLVLADQTLTVQLDGLRSGADKVVLVASPAEGGKTFGEIGPVSLTISTPGEEVATFSPRASRRSGPSSSPRSTRVGARGKSEQSARATLPVSPASQPTSGSISTLRRLRRRRLRLRAARSRPLRPRPLPR